MGRLAKQKSNKAILSNLYIRGRVILEKPINHKTKHISPTPRFTLGITQIKAINYFSVNSSIKINLPVQFQPCCDHVAAFCDSFYLIGNLTMF